MSVQMEQPIPTYEKYSYASTVLEGLGLVASILPIEIYRNGPRHVYVGVADTSSLSAIKPDLRSINCMLYICGIQHVVCLLM